MEISEKSSTEKSFSSQLFSAKFVRNREAVTRGVLKNAALKNLVIFTEKHQRRGLFLIKLKKVTPQKIFSKKATPAQLFSGEYSEIFKNIYFEKIFKRLLL